MTRLILAGSEGPERMPARRASGDPRWFEPLHVRGPDAARDRIAGQVAAGADIVVAPAWQTHRRALLPVGETRRAREWTAEAASVAREGLEEGLERRAQAERGRAHERSEGDSAYPEGDADIVPAIPVAERPAPLVAGVLPLLDEQPEAGSGRLAPPQVAADRDYRDQAGLLSDSDIDLILVEGQSTIEGTRIAVEAVVSTGLPAWVAAVDQLSPSSPDATPLRRWVETCLQAGATTLLAPAGHGPDARSTVTRAARHISEVGLRWGGQLAARAEVTDLASAWTEDGATLLAILDGATPEAIGAARSAVDAAERLEQQAADQGRRRWHSFIEDAASMAPGGAALWLSDPKADPGIAPPRPSGFAWVSVPAAEIPHLPHDRFRLIVDAADDGDRTRLGPLLEEGGLLVSSADSAVADAPGLRLVRVEDSATPILLLSRRED